LQVVKSLGDGVDRVDLFAHISAPDAFSVLRLFNNITIHQDACLELALHQAGSM
jgi:hypothetical protein